MSRLQMKLNKESAKQNIDRIFDGTGVRILCPYEGCLKEVEQRNYAKWFSCRTCFDKRMKELR